MSAGNNVSVNLAANKNYSINIAGWTDPIFEIDDTGDYVQYGNFEDYTNLNFDLHTQYLELNGREVEFFNEIVVTNNLK